MHKLWEESKKNNSKLLGSNDAIRKNMTKINLEKGMKETKVIELNSELRFAELRKIELENNENELIKDVICLKTIVRNSSEQNEKLWKKIEQWEKVSFQETMVFLKNLYAE